MIDFDAALPKWTPATTLAQYPDKAITSYDAPGGARTVGVAGEDGMVEERVIPYARYVRAVDPAGNIIPLIVSTNRVDAHDGTGYESLIIARKRAQKWVLVDDPPYGMSLAEWHEKLSEIIEQRQAKHRELEDRRAVHHKTMQQQLSEANATMLESLIKKMFKELRAIKEEGAEDDDE